MQETTKARHDSARNESIQESKQEEMGMYAMCKRRRKEQERLSGIHASLP
jgi:hypothetical protein